MNIGVYNNVVVSIRLGPNLWHFSISVKGNVSIMAESKSSKLKSNRWIYKDVVNLQRTVPEALIADGKWNFLPSSAIGSSNKHDIVPPWECETSNSAELKMDSKFYFFYTINFLL